MALYLAINNKQLSLDKIKFNIDNHETFAHKSIDELQKFIYDKHKTFKGWYYITIDMKKDKLSEEEDTVYNKNRVSIEKPFIIKMKDKQVLPLMDDGKIWKPIPEFSSYLASSEGEILTLKTGNYTKGVSAGHYLKVSLIKDKKTVSKMEYVHILVCKTFHGLGKKGQVVMHMDDDKFNCKEDNLKWGSQSENIQMVWDRRKEKYNMENFNVIKDLKDTLKNDEKIRVYTDTISVEDGFINKFNTYVLDRYKMISKMFKVKIDKISNVIELTNSLNVSAINKNSIRVTRDLKDVKFREVDERLCPVILGMNVDLIEYNRFTKEAIKSIDEVTINSLTEINVILGNILSDEKYRRSFKPNYLNRDKTTAYSYNLNMNMSRLINPNSKIDRLKVGKLIPNIASIPELTSDTSVLANAIKKNSFNDVLDLTEQVSEKVDTLHGYIVDKGNSFTVSKTNIDALSDALDVNAELVTLYSAFYFIANEQVGMVNNLIEIVKK